MLFLKWNHVSIILIQAMVPTKKKKKKKKIRTKGLDPDELAVQAFTQTANTLVQAPQVQMPGVERMLKRMETKAIKQQVMQSDWKLHSKPARACMRIWNDWHLRTVS